MTITSINRDELERKEKAFLSATKFAVVGASNSSTEWGFKIFSALRTQGKDVVPINVKETTVQGQPCLTSIKELPHPTETAVSIVVPPKATLDVLKDAKALGVLYIWLQPGTADDACMDYIRTSGLESRSIYSAHTIQPVADDDSGSDTTGPCNGSVGALENPSVIGDKVSDLPRPSASAPSSTGAALLEKRKRPSQSADVVALKAVKVSSDTVPNRRPSGEMLDSQSKQDAFFKYSKFAVVGASNNPSKVGYTIFHFLKKQGRDAIPVNIRETTVQDTATIKALSDLPDPTHTAVSVVVPPKETLKILKAAKDLQIPMIWLQPGTVDELVLQFMQDNDLEDKCIYTPPRPSALEASINPGEGTTGPCGQGPSILDSVVATTTDKMKAAVKNLASPCLITALKSMSKKT